LKKNDAKIQFVDFKVLESHIVFKEAGKFKINLGFNPSGKVNKANHTFVLKLGIQVHDEEDKFFIELVTESIFDYSDKVEIEEYLNSLFILNAPAIVFPYLRAYITNLTAQSGMSPLILPTLNLSKLGEDLKENIEVVD